jgi:hypothetical protein
MYRPKFTVNPFIQVFFGGWFLKMIIQPYKVEGRPDPGNAGDHVKTA